MIQTPSHFSFSIIDFVQLLKKWRKQLYSFMAILSVITATILFFKPNIYYSYCTAVVTNANLNDKSYLFNDKIDDIYSAIGTYDDLNRAAAVGDLDTTYKFLIKKFNLIDYYNIDAQNYDVALQKTIKFMRDETVKFEKTEAGLLRIHVWDQKPDTAAIMANALMTYIEGVNRKLQVAYNQNNLLQVDSQLAILTTRFQNLQSESDINSPAQKILIDNKANILIAEINRLEALKAQFETAIKIQQPSLRVVEEAYPNPKHVSPKRLLEFTSVVLIGFCAFCLLISVLEYFNSAIRKNE